MLKIYKTYDGITREIEEQEEGCWISLYAPTDAEILAVSRENDVEVGDLKAALDDEERSRIQIEDEYTMILVDIPTLETENGKDTYVTLPMSIIVTEDTIITVCLEETTVLSSFIHTRVRNFHTHMKTRFILQILYKNASLYLQYLRNVNKKSELVEKKLHASTKNQELIELLELEKSLVYFTTSLRSNEVVLEKLMKTERIKQYPEDEDLLEDVIIENKQAIEMSNIYSGILSGMMDAFASVISNNLNIVMKFLATMTIVLSIPTMIFSAYGMNVNSGGMPFANSPYGFLFVIMFSIALSIVITIVFAKKKMF